MSEAPPATTHVTTTASPTTSGAPPASRGGRASGFVDRGDSRGRGGRGAGRGGARDFRGRGRGGGTDSERGRGRGRSGDRGRGRGRGTGQHSHRSRTGKKRSRQDQSTSKDNRFYEDGTPVDPNDPQSPPAQRSKKESANKKATSDFELLRTAFTDAAAVAEFVRDHGEKRLTEAKQMNMFLQAISNRPDTLYQSLMNDHKPQVVAVLERMYGIYASAGTNMPPCAHEFVIRCEQQGVRKASWADDLPPTDSEAAALLTPRDIVKRLASLHPVGRLQRLIELSASLEDMSRCVAKTAVLFDPSSSATNDKDKDTSTSVSAPASIEYAAKCQLISKLASKARRVVTEPAAGAPTPADGAVVTSEDALATEDASQRDTTPAEPPVAEVGQATAPADEVDRSPKEAHGEAQRTATLRTLSEEERESFKQLVSTLLVLLKAVLNERPPSSTLKPTGKMMHFAAWCKAHDLLHKSDDAVVAALGTEADEDLAAAAAQLESVITLKALPAGDEDALRTALDDLWEAGGGQHFQPHSADVLSAIATAASATGISDALRKLTAERLVDTQVALQTENLQLPRRALRLVNSEQNKVKQAALAEQLESERVARDDVMKRATAAMNADTADGDAVSPSEDGEQEEAEELTTFLDRETSSDDDN